MKKLLIAITLMGLASTPSHAGNATIKDAIADPTRLEDHRARDEGRKPKAVLSLAAVKKGDKIADLAAGSGYYTALLSRVVGEDGRVYAVDPVRIFEAFPNAAKTFPAYQEKDPRENIEYSVQKFDELTFGEPLDGVVMGLYYHDTLWTGVDRAAMNSAIFDAVKSGGFYLVFDHNAAEGASEAVTQELHRMPAGIVMPEILDAGFEFAGTSDALVNAGDEFEKSVFDAALRGKTDRFVYLFRKP